jgi:hypothetical protein
MINVRLIAKLQEFPEDMEVIDDEVKRIRKKFNS